MSVNVDSPAPSPPHDLRHLTSSTNLSPASRISASRRSSQLISRSPASIPSSPTSVRSSSSAIFERDIEPITPASSLHHHHHHHHPSDPHRTARGHNSESLEHSVPSVLDSAAEILTTTALFSTNSVGDEEEISIITPNTAYASPSSSTSPLSTSRSPSPSAAYKTNRAPMLLNFPNILPGSSPKLGAVMLPPIVAPSTAAAVPNTEPLNMVTSTNYHQSMSTPTSAYHSLASSASSSPTTTTMENHPLRSNTFPNAPSENVSSISSTGSPLRNSTSISPSPVLNASAKRLSFLSYTDLLTSTPSSTLPLSSLTTALTANQPEPLSRSLLVEQEMDVDIDRLSNSARNSVRGRKSAISNNGVGGSLSLVSAEGGEWEREGLGRGLEERLEMVAAAAAVSNANSSLLSVPVTAGASGV